MGEHHRAPLVIAAAGAVAALTGSLAINLGAWHFFERVSALEFKALAVTIWTGITEGADSPGFGAVTVEGELLLVASVATAVALLVFGRRRSIRALLLASLCGVGLLVGATIELASLPTNNCLPGGSFNGQPTCLTLFSTAFEGGRGLDGWQLWLVAFGGLLVTVGTALHAYTSRVHSAAQGRLGML